MAEQERLMQESGYSQTAIRYFLERKHVGQLPDASVNVSYKGPCGDLMEFTLKIEGDKIETICFQAIGCAASFASGEALSRLVEGRTLDEGEDLTVQDVLDHIGGLPEAKQHCASLAIRSFRRALYKYLAQVEAKNA